VVTGLEDHYYARVGLPLFKLEVILPVAKNKKSD